VFVDGCIRDYPKAQRLGLGLWLRGVTPNYHAQTGIFPTAVNVPVACGGTVVEPGDIVVADDDGAVVVPIKLARKLLAVASEHAEWEEFSRMRLAQGGDMRLYYPLSDEARSEYEEWRAAQSGRGADGSAT
jgi:regulator of RNase E activity RraA